VAGFAFKVGPPAAHRGTFSSIQLSVRRLAVVLDGLRALPASPARGIRAADYSLGPRRLARCTKCGGKGITLQHPSWAGMDLGWSHSRRTKDKARVSGSSGTFMPNKSASKPFQKVPACAKGDPKLRGPLAARFRARIRRNGKGRADISPAREAPTGHLNGRSGLGNAGARRMKVRPGNVLAA